MKAWRSKLCAALLGASVLVAASAPAARGTEGIFRFRLGAEPTTLDWNLAQTPYEIYLLMNLMEGLVHLDAKLKPQPALAESWKISSDRKVYTFKLRANAKWSDGKPVTAQHFVDGWKRLLSPVTAAPYAYFLFDVENAELYNRGTIQDFGSVGVKALDDRTLQVKLAKPVAYWIFIPSFWVTFPIRRDLIAEAGNAWTHPGSLVTAGPYVLTQHDQGSAYVLKPNLQYYGGAPQVSQAIGEVITDDLEALHRFEAGQLDFMNPLPRTELKNPAVKAQIHTFPYLRTVYLGFNQTLFPLSNPHVRRAIAMAISPAKVSAMVETMDKSPGSFVPPGVLGYDARIGVPYDPEAARRELKLSGYNPVGARPLSLLSANNSSSQDLDHYIQQELKTVLGLNIAPQPLEAAQFATQRSLKSSPMFLSSWVADYPDPDNFMAVFTSASGNNHTGWANAEYDAAVRAGREASSPKGREAAYRTAQKRLLDDEVVIRPLYYDVNRTLIRAGVSGLEMTPLNHLFFGKVRVAN